MPGTRATGTLPAHLPAMVAIRLLGAFVIAIDGQELSERAWGNSRKARSLVKLLALTPGQHLHRDQILDALWPEVDPDAADRAFHQSLYLARRAIDPRRVGLLALRQDVVFLAPAGGVAVDLVAFTAAASQARATRAVADLEAALARYTGEVLTDDRYEDWTIGPREAARTTYLGLLRELAAVLEARGDREGAIGTLNRFIAAEPASEAAHAVLMRLYAQTGQRAQALAQFRQLREVLRRDLDVEPDAATQRLYAALLARHPTPEAPPSGTPIPDPTDQRHNLPAPTTALFGRESAIVAVRETLARARLVTLVGAGGCGKTRLALAVGYALTETPDAFPGGIWWADLAPLADEGVLLRTVARALGVRERPGEAISETLVAALRERRLLLILDNCEHLVAACADLAAALLAGCPGLRVLATSREALRAAGELTWRVPSLPVPALDLPPDPPPAAFAEYAAVQLFLDRAQFARPGFAPTGEDAGAVAAICRRLDGIPLALELAAARLAVLAPPQLAARLDDALRLLTGGPRTALPRHQTLRGTLDWSYQFLAAPERALLDRLAVFAGGCTLTATEEVCGLGVESLDLLAALVDKSLVLVELGQGEEEPRYRLLETVRQFAAERLAASGETDSYRERHAAFFLHLAEDAEPELRGSHQAQWIARISRDLDNLRAALTWFAARGRVEEQLRLASALERIWASSTFLQEGIDWLDTALARTSGATSAVVRARANFTAAYLELLRAGNRATAYAEASLALYRMLGDRNGQAESCNFLGIAARYQGDWELARGHLEEALTLWRATDNRPGIIRASGNLAAEYFDRDDLAAGAAIYEEIVPIVRTLDNPTLMRAVLGNLSLAYAGLRRFAEAVPPLRESIVLMAEVRDWALLQYALITLGIFASGRGDAEQAAHALGASAKLRADTGIEPNAAQLRFADRAADTARTALGEVAFAAAYERGRARSVEEMIAQSLAYLDALPLAPPTISR